MHFHGTEPAQALLPRPPAAAGAPVRVAEEGAPPGTRRRLRLQFLRALLRALSDDQTYDLRRNPSLGVGFLMAIPIPVIAWAAGSPAWLMCLSLPAPLFWAVVVGAAGRVGMKAVEQTERLRHEIEKTRVQALAAQETYEVALDEEVQRRRALEVREQEVLSELKLAETVHRTLVPASLQREDVEVAVRHIPTEFVGGDYLFSAVVDDRYLYLAIGDVSGHGVAAALVVARIHGLIRRLTLENRSRPVTILERLNRATVQIFERTYFFMTFAVFRLDLRTGRLRYATAGHPAQALLRANGRVELLRTPNRLLGIDSDIFDAARPSDHVDLAPGDSLVLFTDGLFEILSGKDGRVLGEQGLHERIASLSGLTPALIAGEILQDLADFQGRSKFPDDVSLMVATYRGPVTETPTDVDDREP